MRSDSNAQAVNADHMLKAALYFRCESSQIVGLGSYNQGNTAVFE